MRVVTIGVQGSYTLVSFEVPFLLPFQTLGSIHSFKGFLSHLVEMTHTEFQGLSSSCAIIVLAIIVLLVILRMPGHLIGLGSGLLNQQVRHVSLLILVSCFKFFVRLHWVGTLLHFPPATQS